MNAKAKGKTILTHEEKRPRRNFLILEFSILSLVVFVIIGYAVVSLIGPVLEGFTIKEQEASTVVFVNRNASKILSKDDFRFPLTAEQHDRMAQFVDNLAIRGLLRIFVTDSSGTVLYAQPEELMETSFAENRDVSFALERRRATARFKKVIAEEQEILGAKEVFVQAVPVTFGGSPEVAGVVYSISRVGLLRKQIEETEQEMTVRIIGGLLLLYVSLFVVVWRASRTIRRQAGQLASYTETLEERVRERTRELEESTKRQLKQAKELARLKDEFIFVAAHELRAPVTKIRWSITEFFSTLQLQKKVPSAALHLLQEIRRSSDALTRLVSNLLGVARLESGTIKIEVHPTDLISVIQEMVLQFKAQAKEQRIHLVFAYDSTALFPFVMSDSERLKEVFSNLISNGIKYNSKDGKVEISIVRKGDFLEAYIADTGIGLTKKELPKLFTKFWRAEPQAEGTGLGLWITKQLVTRMGGEITVKSEKREGTTFTVRLPIAKDRGIRTAGKQPLKRK